MCVAGKEAVGEAMIVAVGRGDVLIPCKNMKVIDCIA
jgi:hypothetical protein